MKKLMIAAAIVCAAAFAEAANCVWSAGDIYECVPTGKAGDDDYAGSYLVYFVDAAKAGVTQSEAAGEIAAGNLDFIKDYGVLGVNEDGYVGNSVAPGYGNSVAVDAYVVVLNAGKLDDATYAYVSNGDTKSTGPEGQNAMFNFNTSSSQTGSNWVQVAPEPTSGLLLLIGMAGLALRRRRA